MDGKTSQGIFTQVHITGTSGSITSHRAKAVAANTSSISIGEASAVPYFDSWRDKYWCVLMNISTGDQHVMLSYAIPNQSISGNMIGLYNQDDNALSVDWGIRAWFIPKELCVEVE